MTLSTLNRLVRSVQTIIPLQQIRNHQIALFFILTIAITWGIWIPTLLVQKSSLLGLLVGAFGPALAALLVTWISGESVRAWVRSVIAWRTAKRWYLAALTVPLLLSAAITVVVVVDAGRIDWMVLAEHLAVYPLALLATSLLGGGQEEFGWRGFALPRLQQRYDALIASLIIGIVWAVWHLPLFVFDSPTGHSDLSFPLFVLAISAVSILFTWLYNASHGIVPVTVLFHGGINVSNGLAIPAVGGLGAITVPFLGVLAVVSWIAAGAVVLRYGRETLADGPVVTSPESEPQSLSTSAIVEEETA